MTGGHPAILDELGRGAPTRLTPVSGGCIAEAAVATFPDGSHAFVKRVAGAPGMFEAEAEGLRALAAACAIRVPEVLAVSDEALVLELIEPAPRRSDFYEEFGRRFAALHRVRGKACGFPHDNFIGATSQPNRPLDAGWADAALDEGDGWPAFFLERRLRFQAALAERRDGGELLRLLDSAEARIADLLGSEIEAPVLLHGDLWGGNYLVDENGGACLIDPATYYGHREADLAMTRLFGGFDHAFYAAYEEAAALAPGADERLPLYQLYHLMNHFNLFGGGYHGRSRRTLERYAGR